MEAAKKLILVVILAAVLPGTASAAASVNEGYLVDSAGTIVKSDTGLCWHTGSWTPTMAVEGCDPVSVAANEEIKPSPKVSAMQPPPSPQKSVPAQTKIVSKKFTFSEEDLFSFNEAELGPKGKSKLDSLVSELAGTKYEVINVTGYTDRIGSPGYNLTLSMHRADVVKAYLISKGIPDDLIKTEGKGETDPVTNSTDCKGKSSAEDVACLQPDRRTEVTVDGIQESKASPH